MLEVSTTVLKSEKEFDKMFDSQDDILVFLYSSGLDEEINRNVVDNFATLALEV